MVGAVQRLMQVAREVHHEVERDLPFAIARRRVGEHRRELAEFGDHAIGGRAVARRVVAGRLQWDVPDRDRGSHALDPLDLFPGHVVAIGIPEHAAHHGVTIGGEIENL